MKKNGMRALFRPVELTQGECWKTILAFSFPIVISYLLQQVYTISDAAIVRSDALGAGGRGRQRHVFADLHFPAIRFRRQRRLLRGHVLQCGRTQSGRCAPFDDDARSFFPLR